MRPFATALALAVALAAAGARAQGRETTVTGYAAARLQFSGLDVKKFLPTSDLPRALFYAELNNQTRLAWDGGDRAVVYADLSLIAQAGGFYAERNADGVEVAAADHDVAALHPSLALSELYAQWNPQGTFTVLAGRKRLVWGPGFAANPSDLLNPSKDPTDPTLQRAGAWLFRLEVPLDWLTLTGVAAPGVLHAASGIPYAFIRYPIYEQQAADGYDHYLLALRAYALLAETDLNLVLYFTNRFQDDFFDKPRLAFTFSRYFWDVEVHLDALAQQGSTRRRVNRECVKDRAAVIACVLLGKDVVTQPDLRGDSLVVKALAGARYMFPDESQLSLEYLYNGDGYDADAFAAYVEALALASDAARSGVKLPPAAGSIFGGPGGGGGPGSGGAVPARFSFDPTRQHYLFASWQKSRIFDDWTVNLVLLASLSDLTSVFAPQITWSAAEWLQLSALGFVPLPGPDSLGVKIGDRVYGEYTLAPLAWRLLFELRAFY